MEFADGRAPKCRNSGLAWLEICTPSPPPPAGPQLNKLYLYLLYLYFWALLNLSSEPYFLGNLTSSPSEQILASSETESLL